MRVPILPLTAGLFFASGFGALLYQIAWQRMLFGWFGVDLDSVSTIVSIFMLGLGGGALIGGWLADRFPKRRIAIFALAELAIGSFGYFSLGFIDWIGATFTVHSTLNLVLLTFLVFVVPTLAMGATLPVLVTELVARQQSVGRATGLLYFINTLGAALGAFAAGFVLLALGGLDGVVAIAAAINLAVCVLAYAAFARSV